MYSPSQDIDGCTWNGMVEAVGAADIALNNRSNGFYSEVVSDWVNLLNKNYTKNVRTKTVIGSSGKKAHYVDFDIEIYPEN